jgi:hypothetical protein
MLVLHRNKRVTGKLQLGNLRGVIGKQRRRSGPGIQHASSEEKCGVVKAGCASVEA